MKSMFEGARARFGGGAVLRLALCSAALGIVGPVDAQTTSANNDCPPNATSCSVNNQTVGDTSNPSSASGTTSNSSLSGTSAASNASDLTISPEFRPQTEQNSTNTTTGTISGGNTNSTAQGGASTSTSGANTGSLSNTTGSLTGGANTSTSSTGASTSSTGASNSSTTIDAANRSVTTVYQKAIFIPPVVPLTPPSSLAVGNIIKETGACGPLQRVVREPVNGAYFGFITSSRVPQGYTERLVPFVDEHGLQHDYRRVPLEDSPGYRLFGHQVTQYTTIVGVGGAKNLALGGGGGGGAWGQAGGGGSSSMQQMVTTIQLRECEIGTFIPPTPVAAAGPAPAQPAVVYVERKKIRQ